MFSPRVNSHCNRPFEDVTLTFFTHSYSFKPHFVLQSLVHSFIHSFKVEVGFQEVFLNKIFTPETLKKAETVFWAGQYKTVSTFFF